MYHLFRHCFKDIPDALECVNNAKKGILTDEVIMTEEASDGLGRMILNFESYIDENGFEVRDYFYIPPDIIFANTLPLKHFRFNIKDLTVEYEYHINDRYFVYQFDDIEDDDTELIKDGTYTLSSIGFVNPEDLKKIYATTSKKLITIIGTITVHDTYYNTTVIKPLVVDRRNIRFFNNEILDIIYSGKTISNKFPVNDDGSFTVPKELEDQIEGDTDDALTFFYVIECALLHPVIVEVFNDHSKKVPLNGSTSKKFKKNKRANIRYIKQIRIGSIEPIDEAFKKRGFIRKTMVWYVTGHWREYKSGKRIFIQGYWKGMLRDSKTSETRNRNIVFIDENSHVEDEE